MSFDRTNPADLAALKSERETDPIAMNYPPNDNQFVRVINDPADNVGGEAQSRDFTAESLMDALDPTDFGANQIEPGAAEYTHILVEVAAYSSIEAYKAKWRDMFDGIPGSVTVSSLDAQTSALSRAEVLFGANTEITIEDWVAARDS